jgi:two-component sensor histidine kinase
MPDYSLPMSAFPVHAKPRGLALLLGWRRLLLTLCFSVVVGLLLLPGWTSGWSSLQLRTATLGLAAMLAFGLFEQWPARLPAWFARWVLQVLGVAVVVPLATYLIYLFTTETGAPPFWHDQDRVEGFLILSVLGVLLAPWVALGALVRQKDALARHQALAFDLERSELERQALDARLHLLQAQVAPHFLFNTLANVQVLVDEGSPQASAVLRNLIVYLRAAVPRLNESTTTLGDELELVKAYLELMHMRIPDRLQFSLHVEGAVHLLQCPPLTLLTLVENAVRHGIDPSEDGGCIDIHVQRRGDRCAVQVSDTGVGLRAGSKSLGTGLTTLRERLGLAFAGDASLSIEPQAPHGVIANAQFPAREAGSR